MKKILRVATIFIIIFSINSCKPTINSTPTFPMDITKVKWLLDDDKQISSWNTTIMPLLLDFDNDSVSLNFSNHRFKALIDVDEILIDGKLRFKIVKKDADVLIIKSGNEVRKYAPLKQGTENQTRKSEFDNLLMRNFWNFEKYYAKFNSHSISLTDLNNNFIRGGIFASYLYNGKILLTINLDGELEKKIYVVEAFDDKSIILKSNPSSKYELILFKNE